MTDALMQAQAVDLGALQKALGTCAPRLNFAPWRQPLAAAFARFEINTPRRVAAAVGQFLVEAGPTFSATVENLYYSTAARLVAVFPEEIPNATVAAAFVGNPVALGNLVYAGKGGNGDVASGDGYRFRGRGLIDVTFRDAYTALGAALGVELDDLTAYCETPAGAAMSGCWWLVSHGYLPLADAWDIDGITRLVNGPGMEGRGERNTYSTFILRTLGGLISLSTPTKW